MIEQTLSCRITEFKQRCADAQIIFDLAGVVFISSAFLRLCLIYFKTFGKNRFSVTNVSKDIYKLFHVSGFAELMTVTPANPDNVPRKTAQRNYKNDYV